MMPPSSVNMNEGWWTFIISCKLICEPKASLQNMAMGQMLLPLVGGSSYL